jgi:hypothetical protein
MKKHLTTLLFCGAFILSAGVANAQIAVVVWPETIAKGGAEIKYLGIKDDMAVFNVSYPNPDGAAFSVMVKDQDGSELYKHTFRDQYFRKQFRLPREEKSKFCFIIQDGRISDVIKSFEVNGKDPFVKDFAVKEKD